jgi:DamX protein
MESVSKNISNETAINKIFMPATTLSETAAYLWHRLSTAGFRGKNPFNFEVVNKIHRVSGGLPGRINEEAQKHLQRIQSPGDSFFSFFQIRGFKSKRLWIGIGSGLLAIALAVWVTGPDSTRLAVQTAQPDTSESERIIKKKIKREAASRARINRATKSGQKPKTNLKTASPVLTKKQKTKPKAATQPAASLPDVAIIYKDTAKTPPTKKSDQKGVHREKWLLRQNPSFYTIQIMGGRNETALHHYAQANRYRYRGPLAYYQTQYKGGTWYPLLYGLYPTRKQALTAKRALPEDIQRLSPWIRKISAVQQAIKESNKGRELDAKNR